MVRMFNLVAAAARRPWGVLGLLLCVSTVGCAYAPGITINQSDSSALTGSEATAARFFQITPALVRQQSKQLAADLTENDSEIRKLAATPQPYKIGPADVISIVVWSHPELGTPPSGITTSAIDPTGVLSAANGYAVSPEGLIQFPYLGTIKLGGLTEIEARNAMTKGLAKYLKDPQVTARIQAFRSSRVYVEGEVLRPGLQAINEVPMTLPEVIGRAGGLTPNADRSGVDLTRNGKTVRINLAELTQRGISPNSILLSNGDQIRVINREESKVFVLGEVQKQTALLMRNGRITLNEALGEAGGVSQVSGDPGQIYVIRGGRAVDAAEIYHLDASNATSYALAEKFELQPRDVVFVDPTRLVNFSRVISLLIPGGALASTSRAAVRSP